MNDTKESIQHPTEILSEDILRFTQDIECLNITLPLVMKISKWSERMNTKNSTLLLISMQ